MIAGSGQQPAHGESEEWSDRQEFTLCCVPEPWQVWWGWLSMTRTPIRIRGRVEARRTPEGNRWVRAEND